MTRIDLTITKGTSQMITIHEKIGLARLFGEQVQAALSATEFRAAVDANKSDGPDSTVCHTHDYCDANMLMLAAWQEFFGGEPDVSSEEDTAIWNDAWSIAKAAEFFA
tara:strand:- start:397 stop:720 length:324 start_codon:yes stop_codon:yes gene_type:complete